jgi:hypothetical protein
MQKFDAAISKLSDKRVNYQCRYQPNNRGYNYWFEKVICAARDLGFDEKTFREMNRDTNWAYYFLRGYSPKSAVVKEFSVKV